MCLFHRWEIVKEGLHWKYQQCRKCGKRRFLDTRQLFKTFKGYSIWDDEPPDKDWLNGKGERPREFMFETVVKEIVEGQGYTSLHASVNGCLVWVVGHFLEGQPWEVCGVFATEDEAVAHCKNDQYFIGAITVGAELPEETISWPGFYHPKAN